MKWIERTDETVSDGGAGGGRDYVLVQRGQIYELLYSIQLVLTFCKQRKRAGVSAGMVPTLLSRDFDNNLMA